MQNLDFIFQGRLEFFPAFLAKRSTSLLQYLLSWREAYQLPAEVTYVHECYQKKNEWLWMSTLFICFITCLQSEEIMKNFDIFFIINARDSAIGALEAEVLWQKPKIQVHWWPRHSPKWPATKDEWKKGVSTFSLSLFEGGGDLGWERLNKGWRLGDGFKNKYS